MRANPRGRHWADAVIAALAVGLLAAGTASARGSGSTHPTGATGAAAATDVLRAEIDALLANGVTGGDAKAEWLQEDLAALEAARLLPPPGEPGLDLTPVVGAPRGGGARSVAGSTNEAVVWDAGEVVCEPVPPDVLTADELAGARCAGAPQPDGTSRYVVLGGDGTLRIVRFGADGSVTRQRDTRVDLRGASPAGVQLAVDPDGDLVVSVDGDPAPLATVDL